ncbi:helix-turn-helix domain-containing protein [Maritalea sp.]|uniref:helix-turn-helix domain-containing protein n=1 Tax=Maritalea sp. TaxID=2003361 RepID=UPI003EF75BBC
MDKILIEVTATATLAIAVFCVVFCLMQSRFQHVYRSFALFLSAVALNNLPSSMGQILETLDVQQTHMLILVAQLFGSMCLAPFFWFYVYALTASDQKRPPHLYLHLILPIFALASALAYPFLPTELQLGLFSDVGEIVNGWPLVFAATVGLLSLAVYPQMGIYIFLIMRRLFSYRRRLKDVYASTEQHELNWILVIGLLALVFWLFEIFGVLSVFGVSYVAFSPALFSFVGLALFVAASLWGLRQRPALVRDVSQERVEGLRPKAENLKYENSALTADVATRIQRKLRAAMELDHLHHNPNLSLWDLAQHVGASPNYISQTLSEGIGENFFDFVNGYRIADAMERLAHSDETVLTITYDVGFNSRSSFYTAFKKVTGKTPTEFRKNNG